MFFPQAMLGGFSFRAGEHTTSAVREIAGPTQNLPEKPARSNFDASYTLLAFFELQTPARKTCPLDF